MAYFCGGNDVMPIHDDSNDSKDAKTDGENDANDESADYDLLRGDPRHQLHSNQPLRSSLWNKTRLLDNNFR